jgi:hypothetical protein
MNKADITIGNWYVIKVSDNITRVRIISKSPYGGWVGKLKNGQEIRVRNATRLLAPIEKMPKEVSFLTRMAGLAAAAHQVQNEDRIMNGKLATEVVQ